jgi:hypothetical protein
VSRRNPLRQNLKTSLKKPRRRMQRKKKKKRRRRRRRKLLIQRKNLKKVGHPELPRIFSAF